MKIAVSATASSLNAMVDPRFGRCAYFVIVEIENSKIKNYETIENTGVQIMRGAGITAAQIVANKGVTAVISGNIGPNAFNILSQNKIKVFTGIVGITVKEAVKKYLSGTLKETTVATGPRFGFRRRWT